MKIEEITETLNDVKTKLKLQVEQRTSYEKLHGEIMDILSIPEGNLFFNEVIRFFPLIFLSLNSFKKYLS